MQPDSKENTEAPLTQETYMEVMEQTPATELVQAMEARGDFKYKGIFAVYNLVLDWTTKFPTNGVLIGLPQLEREANLSPEKLHDFMQVLLGRGTSRAKLIHAIPAIELAPNSSQGVNRLLVYCRPPKGDGNTARRYVLSYVEKNAEALGKWIGTSRTPMEGPAYQDLLYNQIQQGKLYESQAGPHIARLFYNDLDNTAELKKITYQLMTRPVIQRMINNRHLMLINPPVDALLPSYRGVYFNNTEELEQRFQYIADYFIKKILNNPGAASPSDYGAIYKLASGYDRSIFNSLPAGHKQAIMELILLAGKLDKMHKEEAETKTQEELETVLEDLSKAGRLLDLHKMKISDGMRSRILNVKSVLHADYPQLGRVVTFVLHRDCIPAAIKSAREHFDKSGNDSEALILAAMGIENNMDAELLKVWDALMHRVYFEHLPWHVRVWRALFGKEDLKATEAEKIKRDLQKKAVDEKLKLQTSQARKEKKKLVSERLKGNKGAPAGAGEDDLDSAPSPNMSPEELQEAADREARSQELLQGICAELDSLWASNILPSRTHILEKFTEFDENSLIFFLKKHARKEIYSFRVKNEKPEYQWPILISRNYIRRHGKKMLDKAIKDTDEQRAASMPNQEKFDVAAAIEDFLSRLMAKSNK